MTFIASMIGVAVAIVSLIWAIRTSREQHQLQTRVVDLEEAKAKEMQDLKRKAVLRARVDSDIELVGDISLPIRHLFIENRGLAGAHDISVTINDTAFSEFSDFFLSRSPEIREVGPQSSFRYPFIVSTSTPPLPWKVSVTWADDSGEAGSYQTTLSY